jgi:hypothetical protein
LLRTLSEVNQFITREPDEARLITQICQVAVEIGGLQASLVALCDAGSTNCCRIPGRVRAALPDYWIPRLVGDRVVGSGTAAVDADSAGLRLR